MQDKNEKYDFNSDSAHVVILVCYSIFAVALIAESLLLSWENWAIPLVICGVIAAWGLHISQQLSQSNRLWIYIILMMITFFFYGIHSTSLFDLAPVIVFVILLASMSGKVGLINLCMITYYVTIIYNMFVATGENYSWDRVAVSRIVLHIFLVLMAGYTSKSIMKRWQQDWKVKDKEITNLVEMAEKTDDFLTNVSHELRTPIHAVIGLSEVMVKKETNDSIKRDMYSVKNAGHRVEQRLSDILDYTEIDTGKLKINSENYSISSIINDLIAEFKLLRDDTCELIFDMDIHIPSVLIGDQEKIKKILWHLISNGQKFTQDGCVYVHVFTLEKPYGVNLCMQVSDTGIGIQEEEIERVYEKFYQTEAGKDSWAGGLGMGLPIVHGFVRAMGGFVSMENGKDGGITVRVSIPQKVAAAKTCLEINNRDNLCVASYLKFEHFSNSKVREYYNEMIANMVNDFGILVHRAGKLSELNNLQKRYELTHLFTGAWEYEEITDEIEAMAKKFEVIVMADDKFSPREGSCVKVLRKPLYCIPVAAVLNKAFTEEEKEKKDRFYCPGVQVLIVDDEPMNLVVAEGIFRDYEMEVTTAGSGEKALEICEKQNFDLIFMDHMMPGMDGVETMKRLRERKREQGEEVCIVALTANAVSSAKDMIMSKEFDAFVSKPIELNELERTLKHLLPLSAFQYRSGGGETRSMENEWKDKERNELEKLKGVGIQTETGIHYCRNDYEFYRSLLMKFSEDAQGKKWDIKRAYEQEDWKDYAIRVHALKSTAKMIGAIKLSEMAKTLEMAAKEGDDVLIQRQHESMMAVYTMIEEEIANIFMSDDEESEVPAKDIEKDVLSECLSKLYNCLKTYEEERAEEIICDLKKYSFEGRQLKNLLKHAEKYVGDYDMELAMKEVQAIIAELTGGVSE